MNMLPIMQRHPLASLAAASLALALMWAALAPLKYASREQLFEIPKGTQARRLAGDKAEMLPPEVRLTLGVQDVLLLRNSDAVAQLFGPVLILPGQDFKLPFEQAGHYRFACSAHASGQMTVLVVALPDPGLERLQWRLRALGHAIRYLEKQAPGSLPAPPMADR